VLFFLAVFSANPLSLCANSEFPLRFPSLPFIFSIPAGSRRGLGAPWGAGPLVVSPFFLIGRSIYWVIEFQKVYFSPIATTELYFYLIDTMLMIFTTAIYVPFLPATFGLLEKKRLVLELKEGSVEMSPTPGTQDPEGGTTGKEG
jgi:hypothetical protein